MLTCAKECCWLCSIVSKVSQRVETQRFGLSRDDYLQIFQRIIGEKPNNGIQPSRYLPLDMMNVTQEPHVMKVGGEKLKNIAVKDNATVIKPKSNNFTKGHSSLDPGF